MVCLVGEMKGGPDSACPRTEVGGEAVNEIRRLDGS